MYLNNTLLTIIVSLIVGGIIACHTICGCVGAVNNKKKEGFLSGAPLNYQLDNGVPNDRWTDPPVTASAAYQNMYAPLTATGGPVPPKNLFFWSSNLFKPECCFTPQQYSSSSGCACISKEQMQFISSRGGNNTLPEIN